MLYLWQIIGCQGYLYVQISGNIMSRWSHAWREEKFIWTEEAEVKGSDWSGSHIVNTLPYKHTVRTVSALCFCLSVNEDATKLQLDIQEEAFGDTRLATATVTRQFSSHLPALGFQLHFFKDFFLIMCMHGVAVCALEFRCLWRAGEGVGSPGAGVVCFLRQVLGSELGSSGGTASQGS